MDHINKEILYKIKEKELYKRSQESKDFFEKYQQENGLTRKELVNELIKKLYNT